MTQPTLTDTVQQERMVNAVNWMSCDLTNAIGRLSETIVSDSCRSEDVTGLSVTCLTEAVMGVTLALTSIADAIDRLTEAVYDR